MRKSCMGAIPKGAKLLLLVAAVGMTTGCLTSWMTLTTQRPAGAPSLSRADLARLVQAIDERLEALYGVASRSVNLDARAEFEPASDRDSFLVAEFKVPDRLPSVSVKVLERAVERRLDVVIDVPGGWPLGIPMRNGIAHEIELAFAEVLPDYRIQADSSAGLDLR